MDNSNMDSEMKIPTEWWPTNDWSSHLPMLWMAINRIPHTGIFEFGIGYGSTPLLEKYINKNNGLEFYSFESNYDWVKVFIEGYQKSPYRSGAYIKGGHCIMNTLDYLEWEPWDNRGIVFIDSAPGEQRKELIKKHQDCLVLIVHDTEPGAEYVYGMTEILSTFKYRCDLVIEGMPQTTAVSNVYDVSTWKGVYDEKFEFL